MSKIEQKSKMKNKLGLTELVLRDAHQSLFATRMRTDDMLPIASKLDDIGFWSIESWGGATFDACIRFLGEDPWERIRQLKKAMPNIKFLGNQSDKIVEDLMSRCRGFVCAGIEDFGIAPIEAMASGAPVIAIGKGGFLDSVKCITKSKNNQISTGLLFKNLNAKDIIDTLNWFEDNKAWKKFDSKEMNEFSKRFDKENFSKKFEYSINKAIDNFQKS